MQFSAAQIALMIDGKVAGNENIAVQSFAKIEEANAGQLAFLANLKYEEHLYSTKASIVIVSETLQLKQPINTTLIKVKDAYAAFAILLNQYEQIQKQQLVGIQQPVYISSNAKISDGVFIGAFAYIGDNAVIGKGAKIYPQAYIGDNVIVGNNTIIYAGVKIYHDCVIGNDVIIHAGTVVGSDGFGFAPLHDGTYKKIPQIGNVIIEDEVEIGANTVIDRATMGNTIIKQGAKLDNLIQIAHNVEVGEHSVIAAQVGVSGSTKIGKNVMIGGQAGLAGHITIGDGAKINGQTGANKSLRPGQSITGTPSYEFGTWMRIEATKRKLPDLEKRIEELEKIIAELKQQ
jgi:UDP-3-O-[3-hydroxymyristoyl] glucosamine N-acyltransferase